MADLSYANVLLEVQKRLNIRGYRITQLCLLKCLVSFPVSPTFPFVERLNEIFHWIQDAGLYEKWRREDDVLEMKNLLKKCKLKYRNEYENNVERFQLPIFIVYGWCLGVIVLFIEIIWKNFAWSVIEIFQYKFSSH